MSDAEQAIRTRLKWVQLYQSTNDAGLVCRRCGISRPTLRKWWRRFQTDGEDGLREHSRRPHKTPPLKVTTHHEKLILQFRKERNLGAKRIQAELLRQMTMALSSSLQEKRMETKSDERILAELTEATEGLDFMSESDYPLATLRWEATVEPSAQYLRGLNGEPEHAPVRTESLTDFFRVAMSEQSWKGEAELAIARRYQRLVRALQENLSEIRVYKVGAVNMPVYVVGRSASGDWLGVSTRVVET